MPEYSSYSQADPGGIQPLNARSTTKNAHTMRHLFHEMRILLTTSMRYLGRSCRQVVSVQLIPIYPHLSNGGPCHPAAHADGPNERVRLLTTCLDGPL